MAPDPADTVDLHAWFLARAEAYLAGGLDDTEQARFEAHLAADAQARAHLDALRADERRLRELLNDEAPDPLFEQALIAGFRNQTLPSRLLHPMVRRAATATAAAIVLAAVGFGTQYAMNHDRLALPSTEWFAVGGDAPRAAVDGEALPNDPAAPATQPAADGPPSTRETREGLVQYDDVFRYPDNWPELSSKRDVVVADGHVDWPDDAAKEITRHNESGENAGGEYYTSSVRTYVTVPDGGKLLLGGQVLSGQTVNNEALGDGGQSTGDGYFKPSQIAAALVDPQATGRFSDGREDRPVSETSLVQATPDASRPAADPPAPPSRPMPAPPAAGGGGAEVAAPAAVRKIIRNGTVEFEIDSFDSASATITKIIAEEGGYVASTDAEKLENGKVRGTMVVRMPPDRLDTVVLKLRGLGDLKSQKITAADVTRQYVDLEAELRAASAMARRLLEIIEGGKGEIKDLLEAEKQLGEWRTKIEKLEGERRFIDNQVALSTLAITLQERDIRAASALVESEKVNAAIETEAVEAMYAQVREAVGQFKGRLVESELKQYDAGQLGAKVVAEVPPDQVDGFIARIRQLGGRMASFDRQRRQSAQDGSTTASAAVARVEQRPTRVALTIYNLANIAPRQTTQLTLAAVDVEKAVETIRAQAMRAGGRIVTGTINRDRPSQTSGVLDIEVPDAAAAALIQSVRAFGEVMRSGADTASDTVNTTTAKQGIRLNLVSIAALAPRQTITINATAADLAGGYRKVLGFLKDERISARLLNTQFSQQGGGAASGVLEFELNRAHEPALWEAVKPALAVLSQSTAQADAAADAIDSKVRVRMLLMDQRLVPPRQTSSVGLEVADVEKAAGVVQAAAAGYGGRTIDWQFSRQRGGMNTGRLVVEVPAAQAQAMLKQVADAGTVRTIESSRNEQVPEGAAARLRLQIELSNAETLVGRDEGLIASLRDGLATSIRGLLWSVQLIIIGLLVVGPWALLGWVGVKLWKRSRRRQAAA